ncbi:MAG: T9SS type A sorting domain-containing protein [Taibaiella sp.]|nr:T9SS type A sorting domain-containing protein [Taibaiella sp.]
MDSAIGSHYKVFADTLKASVSPVGTVWRYIRRNYPGIELYQPDDSHPSVAGSYAAACCFYTAIFRRDPTLITFNAGLAGTDAAYIRTAVKEVVYNHLTDWNIGVYDHLLDSSCHQLSIDDSYRKTSVWRIMPNPVSDILTVELSDYQDGRVIAIYNVYGQLVKDVAATQGPVRIDFSEYPQGIYIIRTSDSHLAYRVLKR